MAARAIWKGMIRLDKVEVPVKLYSAVEDRRVHFRLLHATDRVPVEQRMVNASTGHVVPSEVVRKGYEVEGGAFVLLDEDELEALEPEPSRTIEITRFVPPRAIDHRWYVRPYWLGPDGAGKTYFALAKALEKENREGVARWTMRRKEYRGALRARNGYLMLNTLRSPREVVPAEELEGPTGRKPEDAELEMAERLVDALSREFDPGRYRNEYRERVLELVKAKAEGQVVPLRRAAPWEEPTSLEDALSQSLERAEKERVSA